MSTLQQVQSPPTPATNTTRTVLAAIGTVVVSAAGIVGSAHQFAATGGDSFWEIWVTLAGAVLLLAGGIHLLVHRSAGSWPALGPGAVLCLGFWQTIALSDPNFIRSLILAHLAIAVLVAGVAFSWQAPVVLGGVLVAVHGTRFLWSSMPTLPLGVWAAIGVALVVLAAVTYRRWQRGPKIVVGYVRRLR